VFAPVVTGAPTKKTKFPNTPGVAGEFFVYEFFFVSSHLFSLFFLFHHATFSLSHQARPFFPIWVFAPLMVSIRELVRFGS
jgi:hypothetical protein